MVEATWGIYLRLLTHKDIKELIQLLTFIRDELHQLNALLLFAYLILIQMNMDAQGFLNNHLRNLIRTNNNAELLSMPHQQNTQLNANLHLLPKQLQHVFTQLFNANKNKIVFIQLLPFKIRTNALPACNTMLSSKTESYRCFDCQLHPDSLLCQDCFKNGKHLGHRYIQVKDEGNCDCGSKSVMKEGSFCPSHKGQEEVVQINSSEEFIFNLYIRQMFIWILKLFTIRAQKDGQALLLHFINYLTHFNDQSLYYNKLTTNILFSQSNPIADHLFYISLNVAGKSKLSHSIFTLLFKMLMHGGFKEKLLTSLILNYNKVDHFQSSKYVKLFYPLLNQTKVVVAAMQKNPIPLRPQRQFSIQSFYFHLSMVKDIDAQAAKAFLSPLLIVDPISFPFLAKVEQQCQSNNNLIVTVFPEFQKQEIGYYKLLMMIIGVIEDKVVLAAMMKNYFKMSKEYSFKKNKIILVPHRILVLLIYKYFQFNISLIDTHLLASILELTPQQLHQFLYNTYCKFAQCIFQFSSNLSRPNYFQNYLPLYVKQNSQVICIDYLAMKMLPRMTAKPLFHSILRELLGTSSSMRNNAEQQRMDLFKARNIFLKTIIEIISSERAELVVSSMLGKEHPHLQPTLQHLFQTIGEISSQQLLVTAQLFNFKELRREMLDHILHFDTTKKKYVPLWNDKNKQLNVQVMMSLLQTKFSKFVNRKCQGGLYLSKEQQNLKDVLLNCQELQFAVSNQLQLIQDIQDHQLMIKELLRTLNSLKIAYAQQESSFNHLYLIVIDHVQSRYGRHQDAQSIKFLQQIDHILSNSKEPQPQENKKENEKRKELLKLKKQQMMKKKKIKENQQKFIKPEQHQIQTGQICLICRQSSKSEEMCYVGKIKLTSLLYNCIDMKKEHAIFKSCYHTVHYDCFTKMDKVKQTAFCPLCKSAINILLPLENTQQHQVLQKITKRIEEVLAYFVLSSEKDRNEGLIFEAVCYLANVLIANLQDLPALWPKQRRIFKIVYSLINHNLSFQNRYLRAEDTFNYFTSQEPPSKQSDCYQKLVDLLFKLCYWTNKNITNIAAHLKVIHKLSDRLGSHQTIQIVNIINDIISLPQVSELEPLLFQMHNGQATNLSQAMPFFNLWTPPQTVEDLLLMRQKNSAQCKIGHQICMCVICHKVCCLSCKKTNEHIRQAHPKECLFFNIGTGGLFYFYRGAQLAIRCLYINDLQKIWKPEYKADHFVLDSRLYRQILGELKSGNLFTYVINTFQGLKSGNISDRI